jgi:hypothetical protein
MDAAWVAASLSDRAIPQRPADPGVPRRPGRRAPAWCRPRGRFSDLICRIDHLGLRGAGARCELVSASAGPRIHGVHGRPSRASAASLTAGRSRSVLPPRSGSVDQPVSGIQTPQIHAGSSQRPSKTARPHAVEALPDGGRAVSPTNALRTMPRRFLAPQLAITRTPSIGSRPAFASPQAFAESRSAAWIARRAAASVYGHPRQVCARLLRASRARELSSRTAAQQLTSPPIVAVSEVPRQESDQCGGPLMGALSELRDFRA